MMKAWHVDVNKLWRQSIQLGVPNNEYGWLSWHLPLFFGTHVQYKTHSNVQ